MGLSGKGKADTLVSGDWAEAEQPTSKQDARAAKFVMFIYLLSNCLYRVSRDEDARQPRSQNDEGLGDFLGKK